MLAVRLPEHLEYELNRFSKIAHKTKSDVVKEALSLFFQMQKEEKTKTSYELGEALFGRYGSEEGNLSTTYKLKIKEKLKAKHAPKNPHR